jgi:hypothetical protein
VGGKIEEQLHLVAGIRVSDDRRSDDEEGDQVATYEEWDGQDPLEDRELPDEVLVGDVTDVGRAAFDGQPVTEPVTGGQPHGVRDLGGQTTLLVDTVGLAVSVGKEDGQSSGPQEIDDGVGERFEEAGQIESRGEHTGVLA